MSGKSPRKLAAGKKPTTLKALQSKMGVSGEKPPNLSGRPRRFSLIYSSDSSLSDIPQDMGKKSAVFKNRKGASKVKRQYSNSVGKNGKLISNGREESAIASDSEVSEVQSGSEEIEDLEEEDDDDDDSDGSMTSSDDDIDFVRLTAERKKNAMKQLHALKRGKTPADISGKTVGGIRSEYSGVKMGSHSHSDSDSDSNSNSHSHSDSDSDSDHGHGHGSDVSSSELSDAPELDFNFKGDDGIKFGDAATVSNEVVEDLGEEVKEEDQLATVDSGKPNVDRLAVPNFSDSEESDYNIDQEAYFKTIDEDNNESITGMDPGIETGDDDMAILDAEEQNMVKQLEHDGQSSFYESQDDHDKDNKDNDKNNEDLDYDEDDDEDAIMSDFDMPFYEDPKFSNLYYYDGSDQPLTLSTSLPLVLSEEKRKREERRQMRQRERQERLKRRMKSKRSKREHSATPDLADDEYVFGLFFQSDDERRPRILNDLESPLRRLSTVAVSDKDLSSGDDEYEDILLDIAHMPTDEEDDDDGGDDHSVSGADDEDGSKKLKKRLHGNAKGNGNGKSDLDRSDLDGDDEDDDDDDIDIDDYDDDDDDYDDDISVTNVFIDIDDLDPDGFYFHYDSLSDEDGMDSKSYPETPDDHVEAVIYVDDESTDEDETLPPPNTRRKIGTKAKEVVSANVVGLKPPKLGTWKTDNKPFSIIDGLSTKSLYPAIQQLQQIVDPRGAGAGGTDMEDVSSPNGGGLGIGPGSGSAGEKEELTLNELLNMSELEDDDDDEGESTLKGKDISTWYHKPSVPLSAFRNKGVSFEHQEDEYMLPVFSARKFPIGYVGSERTRRKIDKMKEYQRKKDEKRRKLKKKKKLLKMKRERQRLEKQKLLSATEDEADVKLEQTSGGTTADTAATTTTANIATNSLASPGSSIMTDTTNTPHNHHLDLDLALPPRKNSVKGLGMEDIDELLKSDEELMLTHHGDLDGDIDLLGSEDADLLVSLAAPIDELDFDDKQMSNIAAWRRRNSIAEAAAENMRVTKNGLFSETALADLEEIIGGSAELPKLT